MKDQKAIIVYTDGACLGNPGPGGYGIVLLYSGHRKEISEGYRLTTNNRMEILAAVEAIRAIKKDKRHKIIIHSDSRLLVDAINKGWLESWKKKGWKKSDKSPVLNIDIWKQLDDEMKNHDVSFCWVQGHADIVENERCDVLSKLSAAQPQKIDYAYENACIQAQ